MSQFQYCDLTRHDLPELRALQRRLFPVNYNTEFYESLLSVDVISILAFQIDKMVGVATGRVRPCKFRPNKYQGYITTLHVDVDYRRHQLGSVLLSKYQQSFETRDCEYVYLHCKADNDTALAFYTSQGYRVVRRLPGYYIINHTVHDAYVVRKELPLSLSRVLYSP